MIRPLTLLSIVAAAGAGLHVYNTKHAVSLLDRDLRTIAASIREAESRTQALEAEWAWATEQERLRALAQRHLALEPMQPTQFVRFAEAERRLPPPAGFEAPAAHFASPHQPAAAAEPMGRIALLPPEAGSERAATKAPAASPPEPFVPPSPAALAALAAAAQALPLPAPAAPEPPPYLRSPAVFVARPVEPRPAEPRAPEPRQAIAAPEPARAAAPPPRATPPAAPPRPAAAPVLARPAPEPAMSIPAAPALRPPTGVLATQVAVASVAPPPRAPNAATSLGSFGSALNNGAGGGGSALGSARAALPPPVAFGSGGAGLR